MKYQSLIVTALNVMSLPVRGAWVEMPFALGGVTRCRGRSPCGERGLKSVAGYQFPRATVSLPVRGAWVEILPFPSVEKFVLVAPRAGSVG